MGVSHGSSSVVRARRIARRRRAGMDDRHAEPPPPEPLDEYRVYTGTLDADGVASIVALGVDRRELTMTAGGRQPRRVRRRGGPQRRAGGVRRRHARAGRRALGPADHRPRHPGVPALQRAGRAAGGTGDAGGRPPGHRRAAHDRSDRAGQGHRRRPRHGPRRQDEGGTPPDDGVRRGPARPGVDHAGDGPPPPGPRARRLRR